MDWDKLKIFHTVAEAGSFTNASTILNLSQSAISRQIQYLEQDLKIHLFERHARGLVLTNNGEYLYKTANEVISKLKDVEATLVDEKDKITGKFASDNNFAALLIASAPPACLCNLTIGGSSISIVCVQ